MKIEARFAFPISDYKFVAEGTEKRANIEVKFKVGIFKTDNTMHQANSRASQFCT
jgi:hypothetical protein